VDWHQSLGTPTASRLDVRASEGVARSRTQPMVVLVAWKPFAWMHKNTETPVASGDPCSFVKYSLWTILSISFAPLPIVFHLINSIRGFSVLRVVHFSFPVPLFLAHFSMIVYRFPRRPGKALLGPPQPTAAFFLVRPPRAVSWRGKPAKSCAFRTWRNASSFSRANEKTSLYQTIHSRTGVRRTQKTRANTGVCPYKTVLLHSTRPCKRTLL